MSGYTRQSVADIIANAVIKAAPINAELNALRDAFSFAIGHKHDGFLFARFLDIDYRAALKGNLNEISRKNI